MKYSYTILSLTAREDFIFATVRYDFDGVAVEVSIPIFQPTAEADVTLAIENRAVSEFRKMDAGGACQQLATDLQATAVGKATEIPADKLPVKV